MRVRWFGYCACCRNPLDVHLYPQNFYEDLLYDSYNNIRPKNFENNVSMYKFYGLKTRKICLACYKTQKLLKPYKVRCDFEIGRPLPKYPVSATQEDIKEWFFKIEEFSKRDDVDDYITESLTRVFNEFFLKIP